MSNSIRKPVIALAWLAIILMLASCSAVKKAYKQPLRDQGPEYLMQRLDSNELKFRNLTAKFSVTYEHDNTSTSFSGQLRIEKDSIIWASISVVGIEMARFMVTNDSVKFESPIKKTFLRKDFAYVNHLLNNTLDFDMLQAFLIGNDFSFFENSKFKASIDNNLEYRLYTIERHKLKKYTRKSNQELKIPIEDIWLNPESFKITKIQMHESEKGGRRFLARYSNFVSIQGQLIPSESRFEIETSDTRININLTYSKIEINKATQTYPFPIPGNYSEIKDLESGKGNK